MSDSSGIAMIDFKDEDAAWIIVFKLGLRIFENQWLERKFSSSKLFIFQVS